MGCGGPCEIEATLKRLLFFCPRQAYIVSCQLEKKEKELTTRVPGYQRPEPLHSTVCSQKVHPFKHMHARINVYKRYINLDLPLDKIFGGFFVFGGLESCTHCRGPDGCSP